VNKRQSILLTQIAHIVKERGIKPLTLASAVGVTEATVKSWLEGTAEPDLSQYERLMSMLRLVPVITDVSAGNEGVSLRDFLPEDEASLFDKLSDSPIDVLRTQLRDLQLQRIRVEEMYNDGSLEFDDYMQLVGRIADSTRFTIDSIGKLDLGAKMGSEDDVEMVYGSPRGPGYDKDKVDKVRASKKVKEEPEPCLEPKND
jgi:transcriptional regulator with XRE-family HTH domain